MNALVWVIQRNVVKLDYATEGFDNSDIAPQSLVHDKEATGKPALTARQGEAAPVESHLSNLRALED